MIQSILILPHLSSGLDLTKDHFMNIEGFIAYYYRTLYFVCPPHHTPTKWHHGITFNSKTTFFFRILLPIIPFPLWAADYFCLYISPCLALFLISSYFFSTSLLHFIKTFLNFTPPTRFYLKQPYFTPSHLERERKLQTCLDPLQTFTETTGILSFCRFVITLQGLCLCSTSLAYLGEWSRRTSTDF